VSGASRSAGGEQGFTLVELLVTLALALVVLGAVTTTAVSSLQSQRFSTDIASAMDEARFAVEWMRRDIRQAQRVDGTSTGTSLTIWVDRDQDRVRTAGEVITYRLVTEGGATHLRRSTAADPTGRIVARRLESGTVFTYAPAVPATRVVTVALTARPASPVARAGTEMTVSDRIRIRNVH
jgi:prepilin-type N-terminal cleavage/methylation domain-containing protein